MNPDRKLLAFAGFNGAMAVIVGSFAAHGVAPEIRDLLATGGHYQMVHAALTAALALFGAGRLLRLAGWLAGAGGLIFCLSLTMVGLLAMPIMGAVAPIGGVLMIAAWVLLVFAAFTSGTAKA